MTDVVVTVPLAFGWDHWIAEGDPAGEPWSGEEWGFWLGGRQPHCLPGERVYVVHNGALRGYAPLVRIHTEGRRWCLVRRGDAEAVTIRQCIRGFRGWRYRWWDYGDEIPFPEWRESNARPEGAA